VGDFDPEVGQTDIVLVYDHGSLVGLCTQDYKSLQLKLQFVLPWLRLRHTHRHTDSILPAYMYSSRAVLKMQKKLYGI